VVEIIKNFTVSEKITDLGACFAIFDRKTFNPSNVLIHSDREKNSASNEVNHVPQKCHFHRGLGEKLFFRPEKRWIIFPPVRAELMEKICFLESV
jgi:hypothetical protein